jgi:hypothetical protein
MATHLPSTLKRLSVTAAAFLVQEPLSRRGRRDRGEEKEETEAFDGDYMD